MRLRPLRLPSLLAALLLLPLAAPLAGCDLFGEEDDARIVEGVDFDALFAPPTEAERAAVLADWATRAPGAVDVEVVDELTVTAGATALRVRVLAHRVGDVRHYGFVAARPDAPAGSLPIVLYAHGGDGGVDLDEFLAPIALTFGALGVDVGAFAYVVPSFRSEPLTVRGTTYVSGGPPSPWDRDVDDLLALLDAALTVEPAADPELVGALGFSRGAGVALLAAARDPRIDGVVDYFGPTDFFGPYVQDIAEDVLRDRPRDLPGIDYLTETLIRPLESGAVTIDEVRLELLRRSPAYFADRLPAVLAHHGLEDDVVEPSQTEALVAAMDALGRTAPAFEAYFYPGMGHFPAAATFPRTIAFLERILVPTPV